MSIPSDPTVDLTDVARCQMAPVLASVSTDVLQTFLTSASQEIQNWLGRNLVLSTATETYDGDGTRELLLRNMPVTSLGQVQITDIDDTVYTSPAGDLYVDYAAGILKFRKNVTGNWTYFPKGFQNVVVTYTSGFQAIPYVIQNAVVELVILLNAAANLDPLSASERLGEYSVDRRQVYELIGQLPQNVQRQLGRYRLVRA